LEAAIDAALRVGQLVVLVAGSHEALPRERKRDPAGIARDPAAAPLLRDVGGGPGAACRVEYEVARVGGHEEAARDDLRVRLDDIDLRVREAAGANVSPDVVKGMNWKVLVEAHICEAAA
jgi:hypothetical protein